MINLNTGKRIQHLSLKNINMEYRITAPLMADSDFDGRSNYTVRHLYHITIEPQKNIIKVAVFHDGKTDTYQIPWSEVLSYSEEQIT